MPNRKQLIDTNQIDWLEDRQQVLDIITDVASATGEFVLTKDTQTGNAIFKPLPSNIAYVDVANTFTETNRFPQVGIGLANSETFNINNPERLLIKSKGIDSVTAIGIESDNPSYIQINMQNSSPTASTDFVATADNGTEVSNYIDVGINGSEYTANYVGKANDGYIFSNGGDLVVGSVTGGKNIIFFTNGADSEANEKMRIDYQGLVTCQNNIICPDGTEINHVATVGQLNTKQDSLGNITGIVKGDGTGNYSSASAGTDFLTPTGNGSQLTGLTKAQVGLSNVTNDAQLKASDLDTDGTLAANSDTKISSQKAVKTYVGSSINTLEQNINDIHMDIGSSGLVTGGVISINSGDNSLFDVSAGYGYLKHDGEYIKISWNNLTANSTIMYGTNYIAVNNSGTLTLSAAKQTSQEFINLGHVFFSESLGVIRVVWNLPDRIGNYSTINSNFVDNCFGTIIARGFNVSEQESPNQLYLNFSEGELWINLSKFTFSQQTSFTKIFNSSDNGITPDFNNLNKVDVLQYNDATQTHTNALVTMTDGYWKKDLLMISPSGQPYYVYGDVEYATEDEAKTAPLPQISQQLLLDRNAFLFYLVIQKGSTSVVGKLYDIRPMLQRVFGISSLASGGTLIDYNDLVNKPTIPTDTNQLTNGAGFITKSSLDANSPLNYNDTTGVFSISKATNSVDGYISSADYITFNSKLDPTGDGSQLTGITASQVGALSSSDTTVTKQGNTFNGASQLVQITSDNKYPAINGSLITNLSKTQVGLGNVPNTDCTNATNITSGTLSNSRLNSSVTLMGNTFNGASQLVQITSDNKYPAINGSLITGITASQVGAISTTLANGNILIGNASNVATSVTPNTAFNQNFETTAGNILAVGHVASAGTSNNIARADHIHPNDSITVLNSSTTLSTQTVVHANTVTSIQTYLPLASAYANKEYTIVNIGVGTVNVVCTGSDTLDGRANVDIYTQNALLKVKSTGTSWKIIGYYSPCPSGYLFMGNTQGQPQALQMSGDGTISAAGVLTISSNAISLGKIAQISANTYLGNNTANPANPIAISTNTAFNVNFETSTSNIKGNGTVSVGTANTVARADHVHPASTDRGYAGTYVEASNSGTQSIPSGGVATKVTFPTEAQDRNGEFNNSTFTSSILQVVEVYAQFRWAAVGNTARTMGIMIYKNGAEVYRSFNYMNSSTLQFTSNITAPIYVSNGDTIEIYASNGNSSALNISLQKLAIRQLY